MQRIHISLLIMYQNNTFVKFCWVPAHCEVDGNEQADKAARQAANASRNCKSPVVFSDVKAYLKHIYKEKWESLWNLRVNNKLLQVESSVAPKNFSGFKTRLDEIKFSRIRFGHTKLTHMHHLNREPQPICQVCHCQLTIHHILVDCPQYKPKRIEFFGHSNIKIKEILQRSDITKKYSLINFLRAINLYSEI